jgi:hypothetical protein
LAATWPAFADDARTAAPLDGNSPSHAEYAGRAEVATGPIHESPESHHGDAAAISYASNAVEIAIGGLRITSYALARGLEDKISGEVARRTRFMPDQYGSIRRARSSARFDIVTACHRALQFSLVNIREQV